MARPAARPLTPAGVVLLAVTVGYLALVLVVPLGALLVRAISAGATALFESLRTPAAENHSEPFFSGSPCTRPAMTGSSTPRSCKNRFRGRPGCGSITG